MLKKVLVCRPKNFQVKYQINPWMKPGQVDSELALKQWKNMVKTFQSHGVETEIIEQDPNYPDMPFAADQGLILPDKKTLILSNFRHKQRRGESLLYRKWFETKGYKIECLPDKLYFEGGGEIIPFKGKYFVGCGIRNTNQTLQFLQKKFQLEIIPLELVSEKFYHLDTCFFVLSSGETAFYYPKAFSKESIKLLEQNFSNLIELSENEVNGFAANSVVSGQTVFIQKFNPSFKQKLKKLGYETVEIDVSEFIKSGGGLHCLTFEIERMPEFTLRLKSETEILQNQTK